MTVWLAPVLVFTAEEAWTSRDRGQRSIHLEQFPAIPGDMARRTSWRSNGRRSARCARVVTGAIEIARANKEIGSSLEAAPRIYLSKPEHLEALEGVDFAEVCITSDIAIEFGGDSARPPSVCPMPRTSPSSSSARRASNARAPGAISIPSTASPDFPDVTPRDADALRELKALGRWP